MSDKPDMQANACDLACPGTGDKAMRCVVIFLQIVVLGFSIFAFSPSPAGKQMMSVEPAVFVNIIEGTVYDPNRRPVPDLWVELQNEFNLNVARVRTGGNGRFAFSGIGSGNYYIKVYTTGTNFEEQSVAVQVINVVANSSDAVYQDVVLKYDRHKTNMGVTQMAAESIFVQEIPDEARRLYKNGVRDMTNKDFQRGAEELQEAIKIFPDYYDALNALGCNYVDIKEYQKSLPYLIHAIDINERSFSSFYSLAYAAYKLNRLPEASEAARGAAMLQPNSVNALLLYGTILRMNNNNDRAMETLLKAEKISKDAPVAEVYWQLGSLYMKLNRNKEAADQLDAYLRIKPDVANKKEVQDLIQKLRAKTT